MCCCEREDEIGVGLSVNNEDGTRIFIKAEQNTHGREGGREGGKEERPDERRRRDRTQRIHPSAVGGKAATARQQMVGLLRVGHGIRMIRELRL